MKAILLLSSMLLLGACASMSSQGGYASSDAYQKREVLKESLVLNEGGNLTTNEIQTLLASRLDLKRPMKVAVVKSDNFVSIENRWPKPLSPVASTESAEAIKGIVSKSKHIKDISYVPKFLLPRELTIRNLRDVAAIMQADLLLVLFTRTDANTRFTLIGADKAKAVATIESIMVDVRTGAIPFTSIAIGVVQLEKDKGQDFNDEEFRVRTVTAAEDKAIVTLAGDLIAYFQ
jgi:hypothetical protein